MRLLLHTLVMLTAAAVLGGVAMLHLENRRDESNRDLARAEVTRFQQQIHLVAALEGSVPEGAAAPTSIDPKWFDGNLPQNPLLGPEHPWVEIAGEDQSDRMHPRSVTATTPNVARFWYNPYTGVVRARVPVGISDAQALSLYNEINDCNLLTLFSQR